MIQVLGLLSNAVHLTQHMGDGSAQESGQQSQGEDSGQEGEGEE